MTNAIVSGVFRRLSQSRVRRRTSDEEFDKIQQPADPTRRRERFGATARWWQRDGTASVGQVAPRNRLDRVQIPGVTKESTILQFRRGRGRMRAD